MHLEAILMALDDFRQIPDLADSKKQLRNYRLLIETNGQQLTVMFHAKRVTQEDLDSLGGESSVGRDVEYCLDVEKMTIVSRKYHR